MMVPIQVIRWYRMQCYDGTDSCAIVVPIRRYCHQRRTRARKPWRPTRTSSSCCFPSKRLSMCLWKRERTYLFLPFVTTLVRQPHYAGGRCADKLEEYTAVLGNRASLDSIAGTYCGVLPPNVETTLTLNADGTYLLIQSYNEK